MSSLDMILPEPVSEAVEAAFLEKLQVKMHTAVDLMVTAVRAVHGTYGKEGVEVIHRAIMQRAVDIGKSKAAATADRSPRAFCSAIEMGCAGSHEWIKLEDTENRQAYRFTRCMWADIFRSLCAQEIGYWICEGDGPMVKAFNPEIEFSRSKTLMMGDDCCDHVYFLIKR